MNFIYAIFITYGITLLIVQSSLIQKLKTFISELPITDRRLLKARELFLEWSNCILCSSFWVGSIVGGVLGLFGWWDIPLNGGLLVGTTWVMNALVGFLGNGYDPARVVNVIMSKDEEK